MSVRRYFRASLWLPLIVTLGALLLGGIEYLVSEPRPPSLNGPRVQSPPGIFLPVASFLYLSLAAGGLPYLLLFVPLFWWLSGRVTERRLPVLAVASPLLFTIIMVGVIVLPELLRDGHPGRFAKSEELEGIAVFSFALSLVYAILALCGFRFAARRGWLLEPSE
jgi:hypothetical protein